MTETSSRSRKPSLTMPTITVCSPPLHCRMDLGQSVALLTGYSTLQYIQAQISGPFFPPLLTRFCNFSGILRLLKSRFNNLLLYAEARLQQAARSTTLYLHIIARGLGFLLPPINHVSWTPSAQLRWLINARVNM